MAVVLAPGGRGYRIRCNAHAGVLFPVLGGEPVGRFALTTALTASVIAGGRDRFVAGGAASPGGAASGSPRPDPASAGSGGGGLVGLREEGPL